MPRGPQAAVAALLAQLLSEGLARAVSSQWCSDWSRGEGQESRPAPSGTLHSPGPALLAGHQCCVLIAVPMFPSRLVFVACFSEALQVPPRFSLLCFRVHVVFRWAAAF